MTAGDGGPPTPVDLAASEWFARMRGPEAPDIAETFEAWLNENPANARAYAEHEQVWEKYKFLQHADTTRSRDLTSVAAWHRRPIARMSVAAAAVFVIGIGGVVLSHRAPVDSGALIALSTRTGELKTVELADGSHVTLDAASKLQVSISAASREVRLIDGTARFDVTTDANREFAVLTTGGSISANGALFDLSQSRELLRVTPLRGSITFKSKPLPPGRGVPRLITIGPGQRIMVTGTEAVASTAAIAAGADWTSGMLSFDGESLGQAVVAMNRHNQRKIIVTDPALLGLKITGGFRANDPAGFAKAVAALLGLPLRDEGGKPIELGPRKKA